MWFQSLFDDDIFYNIEGKWIKLAVVDVFTLYVYVHVSLQIILLQVFPSKYNR